jgi:peptidoglycan L-alanyl-D-glutamate endopeptidase CwlK
MAFKFSKRSLEALKGIHPDLRKVVNRALELTAVDFIVTEGLRTLDRQRHLVAQGASRTLKSRHLTGHAVDVVAVGAVKGTVSYKVPDMKAIAKAFKAASAELKIPIEWGGDWKSFVDTPHFELDRKVYPK